MTGHRWLARLRKRPRFRRRRRDRQRLALHKRQGGLCAVCRRPVTLKKKHHQAEFYATLDHTVPLHDLGADEVANMAVLCRRCNTVKGGRFVSYAVLRVEIKAMDDRTALVDRLEKIEQKKFKDLANDSKTPVTVELNDQGDVKEVGGSRYRVEPDGWKKLPDPGK